MKVSTVKEYPPMLFTLWSILVLVMVIGAITEINFLASLGNSEDKPHIDSIPGLHYYSMLRVVVCGWAIYGIFLNRKKLRLEWPNSERFQFGWRWFWAFLIVAILFNPIFIFEFGKNMWRIIDLVVLAIVIVSFFLFRPYKIEIFCTKCNRVLKNGFYLAKQHSFNRNSTYYGYHMGLEFCVTCLIDMLKNNYENQEKEIEVDYLSDIEKSVEKYVKKWY